MNRTSCRFAAALLAFAFVCGTAARARAGDSLAEVDAAARATGNRPMVARALGDALFATPWPAQIMKVRVDGAGTHDIAGLLLSGVKFHHALDSAAFLDEIEALVTTTFARSAVEEVDVWATVPLPTHPHEVVSGDRAMPTSQTVFAVTARRAEGAAFGSRLRAGRDVFWNAGWRASLPAR